MKTFWHLLQYLTKFLDEKYLHKCCRENQNRFYVQELFSKKLTVYEIMSKNMMESEAPQMTSQYDAYEFHAE